MVRSEMQATCKFLLVYIWGGRVTVFSRFRDGTVSSCSTVPREKCQVSARQWFCCLCFVLMLPRCVCVRPLGKRRQEAWRLRSTAPNCPAQVPSANPLSSMCCLGTRLPRAAVFVPAQQRYPANHTLATRRALRPTIAGLGAPFLVQNA